MVRVMSARPTGPYGHLGRVSSGVPVSVGDEGQHPRAVASEKFPALSMAIRKPTMTDGLGTHRSGVIKMVPRAQQFGELDDEETKQHGKSHDRSNLLNARAQQGAGDSS
jgi:hypothetical protein